MEPDRLAACEAALSYRFADPALLRKALTHSSSKGPGLPSNERLEFLGDAILGAVISDYLFREFKSYTEGQLTKIKSVVVASQTLGKCSRRLGIDEFLVVGKGVAVNRQLPTSLLGDVFEAVIAAIYLDGGIVAARDFILRNLQGEVDRVHANRHPRNYKSLLQHLAQKRFGMVPTYRIVEESGPDHSKTFRVCAEVDGRDLGHAWGRSKKAAEQLAAKEAFARLRGEGGEAGQRAAAGSDGPGTHGEGTSREVEGENGTGADGASTDS